LSKNIPCFGEICEKLARKAMLNNTPFFCSEQRDWQLVLVWLKALFFSLKATVVEGLLPNIYIK